MTWADIVSTMVISSDQIDCDSCQKVYAVTNYDNDQTCNKNKCINPQPSTITGWVQPYKPNNDEKHFIELSEFGNAERNLIKLIYYPDRPENAGVIIRTLPCRTQINYRGKDYKCLDVICVEDMCTPDCSGELCEAVFCLTSCPDSISIVEVQDAIEL